MLCAVLLWIAGARARLFPYRLPGVDPRPRGPDAFGRLPAGPDPGVPQPRGGSARQGLPGDPVAHRRGRGRLVRQRARRKPAEALLPPVPAHRLHLRDRGRGARLRRRRGARRLLRDRRLAGPARRPPRSRRLRRLSRGGRDGDDRRPGGHQPLGRPRPRADQGDSASLRVLRRLVPGGLLDRRRPHPQHLPARGPGETG